MRHLAPPHLPYCIYSSSVKYNAFCCICCKNVWFDHRLISVALSKIPCTLVNSQLFIFFLQSMLLIKYFVRLQAEQGFFFQRITRMFRIQNCTFWTKYCLRKADIAKEAGEEGVRETFLWHGADTAALQGIIEYECNRTWIIPVLIFS